MDGCAEVLLIFMVGMIASAQSATQDDGSAQATRVRAYWVDSSTGLMWVGNASINWAVRLGLMCSIIAE